MGPLPLNLTRVETYVQGRFANFPCLLLPEAVRGGGLKLSVPFIPCSQISIPVIPNTSGTYLYVILDTGCQRSVVGRHWLRGAGIELEARFGLQVRLAASP